MWPPNFGQLPWYAAFIFDLKIENMWLPKNEKLFLLHAQKAKASNC